MRLNLGSGLYPLEGYTNVDLHEPADVRTDVLTADFQDVDEVVAYHLLEHLSRMEGFELLARIRGWMNPGGVLEVEVPDMEEILEFGLGLSLWATYIYGSQDHEGEYHKWGYTLDTLKETVGGAGWIVDEGRRFHSRETQRAAMPCISVRAHA